MSSLLRVVLWNIYNLYIHFLLVLKINCYFHNDLQRLLEHNIRIDTVIASLRVISLDCGKSCLVLLFTCSLFPDFLEFYQHIYFTLRDQLRVFLSFLSFFHHLCWMVPLNPTASDGTICEIAAFIVDVEWSVNCIPRTDLK